MGVEQTYLHPVVERLLKKRAVHFAYQCHFAGIGIPDFVVFDSKDRVVEVYECKLHTTALGETLSQCLRYKHGFSGVAVYLVLPCLTVTDQARRYCAQYGVDLMVVESPVPPVHVRRPYKASCRENDPDTEAAIQRFMASFG